MDILDLAGVVVPRSPGTVSAFGLLTVDVKNDYVQTAVAKHAALDLPHVQATYDDLQARAAAALDREGFPAAEHLFTRTADLRYFGQAFEVRVPVPDGELDSAVADEVAATFHREHRALYGYDFAGDPRQQVEWVNLRVTGVGPITRPSLAHLSEGDGSDVCFDTEIGYVDTPVYARDLLSPGDRLVGPAIIEEFGSTVPVHPGFAVLVDTYGNLVISRADNGAGRPGLGERSAS